MEEIAIASRRHHIIHIVLFAAVVLLTAFALRAVLTARISLLLQILSVIAAVVLIVLYVLEFIRITKQQKRLDKLYFRVSQLLATNLSEADFYEQLMHLTDLPSKAERQIFNESLQKEAEMISYQSQINPHFLYNTLDTIRSKAIIERDYVVADMLKTLALIFRYRINGRPFTTLEDELKNAENYLKIQQFRFGNHFHVETQVDDPTQMLNILIPRLTLQPIIENSIHHGLESLPGGGTIRIHAYFSAPNRLVIRVEDNGIGIDPEALKDLNLKLIQSSIVRDNGSIGGIALININARLKLCFGSESGITIYSAKNKGTVIEMVICNYQKNEEL